jgi:hypothetical protein
MAITARLEAAERERDEAREECTRLTKCWAESADQVATYYERSLQPSTDEQARRIAEAGSAVVERYRMVQRGVAESVELSGLIAGLEQAIQQAGKDGEG